MALAVITLSSSISGTSHAQMITTEEKFQDLFVTAGYGTAFGAAFGAALLSFQAKPDENLRYIAIGASVGFITGSLLGSYVILSPSLASRPENDVLADNGTATFHIKPSFDPHQRFRLNGIQGQWTLARF